MKTYYMLNGEKNGIEIYFDEKPGEVIRSELKANKYRWSGKKKCWYAKQTAAALDLAERLTAGRQATAEQINAEIKAKQEANKLTIEKMEAAAKEYTFAETGEGLYAGWTGCNAHGHGHGQELKKAILAELKKNGIKASARTHGNYLCTEYIFTVRVPKEFTLSLEEYIEQRRDEYKWCWYRDTTNNVDVHRDDLWDMSEEERERIRLEHFTMEYNRDTRDGEVIPTDQFRLFVETVVNSFNSDHSNGMIDYFDVGFYKSFTWKAA